MTTKTRRKQDEERQKLRDYIDYNAKMTADLTTHDFSKWTATMLGAWEQNWSDKVPRST